MKKLRIVSVVTLLFVFCTGYSDLTTAVVASVNGQDVLGHCRITANPPVTTVITPAENIYAHTSAQSRVYCSGISPVHAIVTNGGRRVMQP